MSVVAYFVLVVLFSANFLQHRRRHELLRNLSRKVDNGPSVTRLDEARRTSFETPFTQLNRKPGLNFNLLRIFPLRLLLLLSLPHFSLIKAHALSRCNIWRLHYKWARENSVKICFHSACHSHFILELGETDRGRNRATKTRLASLSRN